MSQYTVIVRDTDGNDIYTSPPFDPAQVGSNGERAGLSDIDAVLLTAAPEVCPWDCEYCNS